MSRADFLRPTDWSFDLERARAAAEEICAKYPFTPARRQISLVSHRAEGGTIEDGTGSLFDFERKVWTAREGDFRHFLPEFKNNYLFEVYQSLQRATGEKIGRVRLMNLAPKACYSLHQDPTTRYHLVLKTNPQAFLIFAEGGLFPIPADGKIYHLDTRRTHTAMNGGEENRLHLVFARTEE